MANHLCVQADSDVDRRHVAEQYQPLCVIARDKACINIDYQTSLFPILLLVHIILFCFRGKKTQAENLRGSAMVPPGKTLSSLSSTGGIKLSESSSKRYL